MEYYWASDAEPSETLLRRVRRFRPPERGRIVVLRPLRLCSTAARRAPASSPSDGRQFLESHKRHGAGRRRFSTARFCTSLVGHMAIGHTRYSTTGSSHLRNAQPLTGGLQTRPDRHRPQRQPDQRRQPAGRIGGSHGPIFHTTVDSEIVLHLLAQPRPSAATRTILVQTVRRIEGAYSLVIMTEPELIGVRDPLRLPPALPGPARRRLGAGQRNLRAWI